MRSQIIKHKRMQLRMPEPLFQQLRQQAKTEHGSVTGIIVRELEENRKKPAIQELDEKTHELASGKITLEEYLAWWERDKSRFEVLYHE
jgi:hypothetical protein